MKVTILGSGAYGLALGTLVLENQHNLTMYTPLLEEYTMLNEKRTSHLLPNILLDETIQFTTNLETALKDARVIIIATPTPFLEPLFQEMLSYIKENQILIVGSKGLIPSTTPWIHENLKQHFKNNAIGILAGPSFAMDIALKYPIGLTLACENETVATIGKEVLETSYLHLERSYDLFGTEFCGTLKNIFAIGAGILSGLGCTESTQAYYFKQTVVATHTLLENIGCDNTSLLKNAGIGDMYLTMSSVRSRNYLYGKCIGEKLSLDLLKEHENNNTIEGRNGLFLLKPLLEQKKITHPLIDTLYQIIYDRKEPEALYQALYQI